MATAPDPVLSFYVGKSPITITATGPKWKIHTKFHVEIMMAAWPNIAEYEYRQYIKGTVHVQAGAFNNGLWSATGAKAGLGVAFPIPADPKTGASPGLLDIWKEDGLSHAGRTYRYGYRGSPMRDPAKAGNKTLDEYLGGNYYRCNDEPQLEGTLANAVKFEIHLKFVGAIINTKTNLTATFKAWNFDLVKISKYSTSVGGYYFVDM